MKIKWKLNNNAKYLYLLDSDFCYTSASKYFKYKGTINKSPEINKVYKIVQNTGENFGCGLIYEIEHKGKNYFVAKDYETGTQYYRNVTQKEIEKYENSIQNETEK